MGSFIRQHSFDEMEKMDGAMDACDAINMRHTTQAILSSSSVIVYRDKLPISICKIAVNFTYDDKLR